MSRDIATGADDALQAEHVSQVMFIELDFLSGTSHACSREHNVDWNGNTWVGAGAVGSIEPVGEGAVLEARGIALTLSALPVGLLSIALTPGEYKGRDLRLWFGQLKEERYLSLPGSSGNYASTTDSAVASVTGDIDVRCKVAMDDWTPAAISSLVSKYDTGSKRSYLLQIQTAGKLRFYTSVDGSATVSTDSTVATGFADGSVHWVRATRDVDDGAGNNVTKFYTSEDGRTWTQLGATVTTAGTTSIFDSTAKLQVGAFNEIGSGDILSGKIYSAEVRSGIDGPIVAAFDASRMNPRQTSAQMATGEVWTVNQSGTPNAHIVRAGLGVVADPVGPFIFKMDQLAWQLGAESAALRLTAESRLTDWNRPRVRRYNDADHQSVHPGDLFFQYTEKQVEQVYRW